MSGYIAAIGLICLVGVAISVCLTITMLIVAARAATVVIGQCSRCEYDLTGLAGRTACPECGHPFHTNASGQHISPGSAHRRDRFAA